MTRDLQRFLTGRHIEAREAAVALARTEDEPYRDFATRRNQEQALQEKWARDYGLWKGGRHLDLEAARQQMQARWTPDQLEQMAIALADASAAIRSGVECLRPTCPQCGRAFEADDRHRYSRFPALVGCECGWAGLTRFARSL